VVGERDHSHPEGPTAQKQRLAGGGVVGAGADRRDAGAFEVTQGIEQRLRPVVQRVVVGQRDRVDAELGQALRSHRRSAEEERLARVGKPRAAVGDAALEIEDDRVGTRELVDHLRRNQRRGAVPDQQVGTPRPSMVSPARTTVAVMSASHYTGGCCAMLPVGRHTRYALDLWRLEAAMKVQASIVLSFQAKTLTDVGAVLDDVLARARDREDVDLAAVELISPPGDGQVTLPPVAGLRHTLGAT